MTRPPFWIREPSGAWREDQGGGLTRHLEEGEAWFAAPVRSSPGNCLIQAALEPLSPVPVPPASFPAIIERVRRIVETPAPSPLEAQPSLLALQEALRLSALPVPSFEVSALHQATGTLTEVTIQWSFLLEGAPDLPPVRIGHMDNRFMTIFCVRSGGNGAPHNLRITQSPPGSTPPPLACSSEH